MIYMKSADGELRIVVLEPSNIDEIKKGRPAKSPDGSVIIAFTADPVWLADKLLDSGGDAAVVAELIDEAAKRPAKPANRPYHKPHHKKFGG